jgi:hypothetical protein
MGKVIIQGAIGVLLLVALFAETEYLQKKKPETVWKKDTLLLPSKDLIRTYSIGFDNLLADLIWMRAISNRYAWSDGFRPSDNARIADDHHHHHHDHHQPSQSASPHAHHHHTPNLPHYDRPVLPVKYLYDLCDLVTTLDPYYLFPYRITSILLLGEQYHNESKSLLIKGMLHNPGEWFFPYFTAINCYFMKQYDIAAHFMKKAADIPGSPDGAKTLLASFHNFADRELIAIHLLEDYYNSSNDKKLKNLIKAKLEKLKRARHDSKGMPRNG